MSEDPITAVSPALAHVDVRSDQLFEDARQENFKRVDRMFAGLMVAQWFAAIVLALTVSPYAWAGKVHVVHAHVWAAFILGGIITSLPVFLALRHPGELRTRMVVAGGQMLWSALLIHLSGGRIETHFHVFGSLAFIAFYRDWRVLVPATLVVAADHVLRQFFWPESVFGTLNPEWWRFLEHALWVVFLDFFLVISCLNAFREMKQMARKRGEAELLSAAEQQKSRALDEAMRQVEKSQETLVRAEKLAAVGQLAASVGHELRNPLAAVRNAHAYLVRKLLDPKAPPQSDPRIKQFLDVMERELNASTKIISDLLDFARERPPSLQPCPIRPLIDEAISVVAGKPNVTIATEVPADLPVPLLDKEQFRQILVNLIQNAIEAMPEGRGGKVTISAQGGGAQAWLLTVSDDGEGISAAMMDKLFQPLFTTKTKGTGLGLAIVSNMVKRHRGTIRVESEVGRGTHFIIELPAAGQPEPTTQAA